jgi:hypothetical protein
VYQIPLVIGTYSVEEILATNEVLCTGSFGSDSGNGDVTFVIS